MVNRAARLAVRLIGVTATAAVATLFLAVGVGPLTGRYLPYTVLTSSMSPTMPAGSVAFVVPVDAEDLRVGDVITYRIPVEDRRVVTHRIVEIVEPGPEPTIVTKGDANDAPDAWSAKLVGGEAWRAVGAVPYLGFALRALRHPTVITISRTVLPALTAVVWLANIWWRRPHQADCPAPGSRPTTGPPTSTPVGVPVATLPAADLPLVPARPRPIPATFTARTPLHDPVGA
ncbi:MAG: signal peptidase I [Actinobacteria bacterium]|nr:signal peptidase I [Actinomycetota bacterium]